MFFKLLTYALITLVIVLIVTELLIPAIMGSPMFPHFRKTKLKDEIKKTEEELKDIAEATHLKTLAEEVQRRKANLENK